MTFGVLPNFIGHWLYLRSQYQRVRVSHTATSHTKGVICPEVRIYVSQNCNKLYSKEKKDMVSKRKS